MREKKKRIRWKNRLLWIMLIAEITLVIYLIYMLCALITNPFMHTEKEDKPSQTECLNRNTEKENTTLSREAFVRKQISAFAREHNLSVEDYQ